MTGRAVLASDEAWGTMRYLDLTVVATACDLCLPSEIQAATRVHSCTFVVVTAAAITIATENNVSPMTSFTFFCLFLCFSVISDTVAVASLSLSMLFYFGFCSVSSLLMHYPHTGIRFKCYIKILSFVFQFSIAILTCASRSRDIHRMKYTRTQKKHTQTHPKPKRHTEHISTYKEIVEASARTAATE